MVAGLALRFVDRATALEATGDAVSTCSETMNLRISRFLLVRVGILVSPLCHARYAMECREASMRFSRVSTQFSVYCAPLASSYPVA